MASYQNSVLCVQTNFAILYRVSFYLPVSASDLADLLAVRRSDVGPPT
jgi:hypothetical protein